MLENLSASEKIELLSSVGSHRNTRKVSPLRVAALIRKAGETESLQSIAAELELADTTMLGRFLDLLKLPDEVQGLVDWGGGRGYLSFTSAHQIARLSSESARQSLAALALENRLSAKELESIIQRSRRGKVSVEEAADEILKLRPIVERQYLLIGKLSKASGLSDDDVRRKMRIALGKMFGGSELLSLSVKGQRFSFLITDTAYNRFSSHLSSEKLDDFVGACLRDGGGESV